MLNEMIDEIPCFLHLLNSRKMYSPKKSRMWFSEKDLHTEAFDKLVEYNLPYEIKEIRDKVRQYFIDFEDDELHVTATQIRSFMLNNSVVYNSTRITKNCEIYLGVHNFKDKAGEKKNKTCVYKWMVYVDSSHFVMTGQQAARYEVNRHCRRHYLLVG